MINNLQKRLLLKLLNNIGIVGAILAAIADIVFVMIMVFGVQIDVSLHSIIIFATINALIGIFINVMLRYQGQRYAELENDEICKKYYNKKVREKKYLSMNTWMILQTIKDFVIKGVTTAFTIFGVIYISIQGSKNPVQILITIATLILFACFGLVGMNSAYTRFYNIQIPYMQLKIEERETTATVLTQKSDTNITSTKDIEATPSIENNNKTTIEGEQEC